MSAKPRFAAALAAALVVPCGCRHEAPAPPPPRRVAVVSPRRQDMARRITLPANVLAYEQATLLAQVPGYLRDIRVDKGDPVQAGDVVATIDAPEIAERVEASRAGLAEAEVEAKAAAVGAERSLADVEQAKAEEARAAAELTLQSSLLERAKGLRKDEANSVQDLEIAIAKHDEAQQAELVTKARRAALAAAAREADARVGVARAKADVARSALHEAEVRLAYATIRAPFDGVVTARFVDRGAMIQMATSSASAAPIVTVARMDKVRVQFEVPETEVGAVAEKEPVALEVDARRGRPIAGSVTRLAKALDPATRTMLVEAELENSDKTLFPGMYGRVTVELERHPKALAVPAEAIVLVDRKPAVWLVAAGRAKRVIVVTGIDDGPLVEVLRGIEVGESLIVGARGLVEGAPVEPVAPAGAGETVAPAEKTEG
jgi:RND family efflux transporter MFP subunit